MLVENFHYQAQADYFRSRPENRHYFHIYIINAFIKACDFCVCARRADSFNSSIEILSSFEEYSLVKRRRKIFFFAQLRQNRQNHVIIAALDGSETFFFGNHYFVNLFARSNSRVNQSANLFRPSKLCATSVIFAAGTFGTNVSPRFPSLRQPRKPYRPLCPDSKENASFPARVTVNGLIFSNLLDEKRNNRAARSDDVAVTDARKTRLRAIAVGFDQNSFLQSLRHSHHIDRLAGFIGRNSDDSFDRQIVFTNRPRRRFARRKYWSKPLQTENIRTTEPVLKPPREKRRPLRASPPEAPNNRARRRCENSTNPANSDKSRRRSRFAGANIRAAYNAAWLRRAKKP